ncbi:MAG: leucyl aminopeptidase [Desulfovibrio sp.]|nr:leucyl aminopeptidase [Desulfovibrio sp.]
MELSFQEKTFDTWKTDCLLVPVIEGCDILRINTELDNLSPWLAVAPAMQDLATKEGALTLVHGHPKQAIPRVLFIGLGKKEEWSLERFKDAIANGMNHCQERNLTSCALLLSSLALLPSGQDRLVEEAVYAACLSLYESGFLKRKEQSTKKTCQRLSFCAETIEDRTKNAAKRGRCAAHATLLARQLANTPANLLTPLLFAQTVQERAKATALRVKILDEEAIKKEGMGALMAVAQGSHNPPRFIILEHVPEGTQNEDPLVFIGKGICFDSGGISLKPAANMHQMKSDMSGACAVFSAMLAIDEEKIQKHIIGILPCAENMPGGGATRPGDVVIGIGGESIEITNTDAEGRLLLCDALGYAKKAFSPKYLIDIATLTGACAVALGDEIAGLFSDCVPLSEAVLAAGRVAGEPFWQLPLWKSYAKKLESTIADICHTGPREGGAINAALFLAHFAGETQFAHLDIAGVDWCDKGTPLCPKGATGFGARTLLEIARGGLA